MNKKNEVSENKSEQPQPKETKSEAVLTNLFEDMNHHPFDEVSYNKMTQAKVQNSTEQK